jgi:two-component system LytT family response regulator
VIADDERPARSFLTALLRAISDVTVVGEATNGSQAIQLIERHKPDVALLDVQMPAVDGLSVVRLLRRRFLPLIIFVTAFDEHAVKAFEMNAVDYLTKPVGESRLREALRRARERLDHQDTREADASHLQKALLTYERSAHVGYLDRIPVRQKQDIVLVPATQVAFALAEGELLHLTTTRQERYTITYRLKDLEARLDPSRFVRLGRGVLVNVDEIVRVIPLPGGMYTVKLRNGQELDVSRIQSRRLRRQLLQL